MSRLIRLALVLVVGCSNSESSSTDDAGAPPVEDAAALPAEDVAPPQPIAFNRLTLVREAGFMPFCVDPGDAVDIAIDRQSDGTLQLTGAYVSEWDLSVPPSCPEGTTPFTEGSGLCLAETTATLTGAQQEEIELLAGALPFAMCRQADGYQCDPCVYTDIAIDGARARSHCCGSWDTASFGPAFRAIEAFVDGMMPVP